MRRILIISIVGLLSFAIGWWMNELQNDSNELATERREADSLPGTDKNATDKVTASQLVNSRKKTLRDFASDDKHIRWRPNHPDTTGYLCELMLHEITAMYLYHGQCAYDYFTYITSDTKLEVLWSYRIDCISDMDFLEKSHGLKSYPKRGDIFATFNLVNDTTINVKYHFPDWTRKVNQIKKDSIFPTTYYLVKESL